MGYAIDLVFLDRNWRVLRLVDSLPPWRMAGCRGAWMTLELTAGCLPRLSLSHGDELGWRMD